MLVSLRAQPPALPVARLTPAPRLAMPAMVDSNIAMTWDLVDGQPTLFAFPSFGGSPIRWSGAGVDGLAQADAVSFLPPAAGIWMESILQDDGGTWYGYYHHEVPAVACGRADRFIPWIGAARSRDRGLTWEDLGVVLEAPPDAQACASENRYVIGGVGDLSAMLDPGHHNLFVYFSQYSKAPSLQGVAVARMPWADRDNPAGALSVWRDGAWLPPHASRASTDDGADGWEYPGGTSIFPGLRPWHDSNGAVDAFWGPSIHWNTYLQRYVMLLNRAKNESFNSEGMYVSYAAALDDPRGWSPPKKILNGGYWYPQVAGLEAGRGTDKEAGQRARFFMTGRSEYYIDFSR
jgi:hypothetical protein